MAGIVALLEVDIVGLVGGNPGRSVDIVRAVGIVLVVAAGDQPSCFRLKTASAGWGQQFFLQHVHR